MRNIKLAGFIFICLVSIILSGCVNQVQAPAETIKEPVVISAQYQEIAERCPGWGVLTVEEINKRCGGLS